MVSLNLQSMVDVKKHGTAMCKLHKRNGAMFTCVCVWKSWCNCTVLLQVTVIENSMGIPVVETSSCVNVWQSNACLSWQHKHGASRSIVRRIGSYLPIDTGRRLFIQVRVLSMFIASAIRASICHPGLHIDYLRETSVVWMAGLDVMPTAQDAFQPIPGLISYTGVHDILWQAWASV